jgi:CheY-like chemotaxis protein
VRRRAARIVLHLDLELTVAGAVLRADTQDVTPFGLFVRLTAPFPVGTPIELAIARDGLRLTADATVVHALGPDEAPALGRHPGNGLALAENQATAAFSAELCRIIEDDPQVTPAADELRIVVADPSTRLLERLSTALANAGFAVATATNGLEALGAAMSRRPDVVLVDRDLPVMNGLALLAELGKLPDLAAVPVILMGEQADDLVRLAAFREGAHDFIPKPFTVLEVILRARRVARLHRLDSERILMRGVVEHVGLPPLLTLLEHERKTGVLRLTRDETIAWLTFVDGRLVRARASDRRGDSHSTLMRVLSWPSGHFELAAATDDGPHELSHSITHLLLEHARVTDESRPRD